MTTVGLISPGAMGAAVGAAAVANAERVLWASEGRGEATAKRAADAGLTDCGSLNELFNQSDIVLSVCPPHDADNVADAAVAHGFDGVFMEGNAISPDRTRGIAARVAAAGATVIDGGIVGGPPWQASFGTCLWLSGNGANQIVELFEGSPLHTNIAGDDIGAASALKMTFAAYTKGSTALLMAILAVADHEGVRDKLEAQWGEKFTDETHRRVINNSAKAWRFAGEMREISATFDALGLGNFHDAAATLFERLDAYKDWQDAPSVEALIDSARKE